MPFLCRLAFLSKVTSSGLLRSRAMQVTLARLNGRVAFR